MMTPPSLAVTLPARAQRGDDLPAVRCMLLSPRELDVLRLIGEGCRDREIADRLFVSHHTVANHVRNILAKLAVQTRAAAVAHATRNGLM